MSDTLSLADIHNVGQLLSVSASKYPEQIAVAETNGRDASGKYQYRSITFAELETQSNAIAAGFRKMGMQPGHRICLMVPPGIEFIANVFALFKAQLTAVLIDPGMGKRNLIQCLSDCDLDGFVTIPKGHVARVLYRKKFPRAKQNVVVGGFFPFCKSLAALKKTDPTGIDSTKYSVDQDAAIIFTTGSTGPPKGVLYQHKNFIYQAQEIVQYFGIQPGGVDISAFPLFALFNISTGCTTIFPEMDFTAPADVNPKNLIDAANDWNANQSFGSPALWNTVSCYCDEHNIQLGNIKTILSAGAPVPNHVLRRVRKMVADDARFFTPYGATESLPVACAESLMILNETAALSEQGAGTCVGQKFPLIDWKVIEISDDPIENINDVTELPCGEIGELIVSGPVVTRQYVTRTDQNAFHKITDGDRIWHRIGDVGYLDDQDRFWFCGRKNHRVITATETLFTIKCEAIFNNHSWVYRSALVGLGDGATTQPAIVVEPWPDFDFTPQKQEQLLRELHEIAQANEKTKQIEQFYIFEKLPTDIRHNSKIFREQIAKKLLQGNCGPTCGC